MAPEAHQSFLVALQRGSPPSCTHRDTFTRDPARKCSGVDFIFQKKSFGTAVAKNQPSITDVPCQERKPRWLHVGEDHR